jgi:hypothetical protein
MKSVFEHTHSARHALSGEFFKRGKYVDTTNCTLEVGTRQDFRGTAHSSKLKQDEPPLTPEDKRLLLGASLRLLGHRFTCGKPILQDDVIRVALLADDAVERAA